MKYLTTLVILSLCLSFLHFAQGQVWAQAENYVLSLDGDGDYVELSDSENLNSINSQVTMEAWIRPTAFTNQWIFIIFKGDKRNDNLSNRSYGLSLNSDGSIHLFSAPSGKGQIYLNSSNGLIELNKWYHVVGVIDAKRDAMKILINGVEVGRRKFDKDIHISVLPLRIGSSHEAERLEHASFAGQIDEVRIWNISRTEAAIQRTMHATLSGTEPGLVGYWRFDDEKNIATDLSPNHSDGKLIGDAHCVEAKLPDPSELVIPTVISGVITDESGQPIPNASVRLEKDGEEIVQTESNASGNYNICTLFPEAGLYNLSAKHVELGSWKLGFRLREGEHRKLNLVLKKAISIEGTLLMLDDLTPHVTVPVQAIRDGKVIDGVLSDENGEYRFINLKPGKYQARCQVLGGYVYYRTTDYALRFTPYDSTMREKVGDILQVEEGRSLKGIDFRFAPFKRGTWRTYTFLDGLAGNWVSAIHGDPDGVMWFGTGGGLSRYDGKEFRNFTTKDGLVDNWITAIYSDPDGVMWLGTKNGVSRYDGEKFVNFTTKDGLVNNYINGIDGAPDGTIWIGTGVYGVPGRGVSRYDGEEFVNFTEQDRLLNDVHVDADGVVWLGTTWGGVSRYDGKEFRNFTTTDGLASNFVIAIHSDPNGVMWFGTYREGVSWYNGKEFVTFTTKDGLAGNTVGAIHSDPDGVLWFGTEGGLSRVVYPERSRRDGKTFVNFTQEDGLISNDVYAIHRAPDGVLWVGTRGGVCRYDERGFQNLTTKDGLVHDSVSVIHRAPDGVLWVGTKGGVSRYDGKEFVNFTTKDGLVDNHVRAIHRDPDGVLWFGAYAWPAGISRYDGKGFVTLEKGNIMSIQSAPDGTLWFGSTGGVHRYDGQEFVKTLGAEDGLPSKFVYTIYRAPDNAMWVGTSSGAARYDFDPPSATQSKDGQKFISFTTKDGLAQNDVNCIHGGPDGIVWFGTDAGISRYDGEKFTNFSAEDGLAGHSVYSIHRDTDGIMWFGTDTGGVSLYDGTAWTSLDMRDGLAGNMAWSIHQEKDGSLLFATEGGITIYRRNTTPSSSVRIVSVKTDKEYTDFQAIPPITTGRRVTIKYSAIDFVTVPEKRQYRYRIVELDPDWRKPTKEDTFDGAFDKPGAYTFEVQAIDRDLNYSESATLTLHVKRPWWVFALFGTIGVSIPLIALGFYFGKRLQTQRAIAQQFNPYIAGRVVGEDLFYGRSDLITDIERTLANNCFLLYGERRIGKTSLQHQLRERLQNADDPTYRFIPAYIDLQGVAEEDFFRTIAASVVEQTVSLFREPLTLRLDEGDLTERPYSYRDLNRDLRTILDHLKEGETRTIKLVLLMDEVDTLNTYSLRTNLNLRGLFMGPLKENLVLVMSGLYLKTDWSDEGAGSPPFNFLSREIQIQPLDEESALKLITEPVKGFYTYEPKAIDLILELSELRPFTIQGFCLRAVNRVLADGRTKITINDIEAIKDSVLAEVQSIRGERAGTSLPASFNEALALIADLKEEVARLRDEAA